MLGVGDETRTHKVEPSASETDAYTNSATPT